MEPRKPQTARVYTDHLGREVTVSYTPTTRRVTIGRTTTVYEVPQAEVPAWVFYRPKEKRPEPEPEAPSKGKRR